MTTKEASMTDMIIYEVAEEVADEMNCEPGWYLEANDGTLAGGRGERFPTLERAKEWGTIYGITAWKRDDAGVYFSQPTR